jgi:hypothetical protein
MIQIDADDGAVRVELPHGEAATIEGLHPGAPVERGTQRALFLEPEEAETLGKMIDYILDKVRIKEESERALRSVRPRLDDLFRDAAAS